MVLTINAGSSSIKFGLYEEEANPEKTFGGQISRIGLSGSMLSYTNFKTNHSANTESKSTDYVSAISFLVSWLEKQINFSEINAIGHRVVQGMAHTKPTLISAELLDELKLIIPYDPDHLPVEIALIEAFQKYHPRIPQYACFDTDFHAGMPRVAQLLPVPRRFDQRGIRRYGFHGLSYSYLMRELENRVGKQALMVRIILAHLGNGASVTAVYNGKSMDTSMGFTPAGGLPMATRSGDLDPGVAWLMIQTENLSAEKFNHLINHESGMLGISQTTGDMNNLLTQQHTDIRSAEAVALFCYQVKKWIGAYAAVLGGVDILVFSGGIGENSPEIRARVCEGLEFLGISLDASQNNENASLISVNESRVMVMVLPTNEELMIAQIVSKMLVHKQLLES
ncbi:acetate/propionate family kinase [Mucilaginibacter kameinonensis]|uniref:acetate/propionate family kinase n=1 Tax=Mucilaginibacter kameinonensis TaxID=452286 RepID=UPI000EF76B56|nr:acetate/propionate family kinase [Mucilaginibacter kameinonensis]